MSTLATTSLSVLRISESIAIKQIILQDEEFLDTLATIAKKTSKAMRSGGKIFFMGNGGSAADAQHLAAEFTGRYLRERAPLPAIALSVNASSITAIANDYSFEQIFARQIRALGRPGDVAIGLSTSGNSENVVHAMNVARELSLVTAGLTGHSGGELMKAVDYCLRVPSTETPRIQEIHLMAGHILCEIVENDLST